MRRGHPGRSGVLAPKLEPVFDAEGPDLPRCGALPLELSAASQYGFLRQSYGRTVPLMDTENLEQRRTMLHALTSLMAQWSSRDFQRRITAQSGVALDPTGVRALYVLGIAGGSARPSDLADELHLTRPSASKLITRLTAAGLLGRTRDTADGRAARIALSAEGQRTYEQLVASGIDLLSAATEGWEEADVRALSALLVRFTDGLLRGPGGPEVEDESPCSTSESSSGPDSD